MTTEPTEPTGSAAQPGAEAVQEEGTALSWLREHSELGVCVLLFALGLLVLTDAFTMSVD
ncbi:tripartite tricarboxylate transporter TctB family protein, partial [Streptomyces anulatus]